MNVDPVTDAVRSRQVQVDQQLLLDLVAATRARQLEHAITAAMRAVLPRPGPPHRDH